MIRRFVTVALALSLLACGGAMIGSSPLGRTQLRLFPADEVNAMGIQAFAQMKAKIPQSRDQRTLAYVRCVARAITAEASGPSAPDGWEVVVFEDDTANAFALPGGKIGVNTGLLRVAEDSDQLATVLGHEVAHVLAEHGNERASTAFVTQTGMQILQSLSGPPSPGRDQAMAVLGLGAQVGIELPFGRAQEREADLMGLDLMASAGFDPRASVTLWQNMSRDSGAGPPEFLSTHPSSSSRIRDLEQRIPQAMGPFERARASGKRPNCS
jgi:predicted Zn-dependent protease